MNNAKNTPTSVNNGKELLRYLSSQLPPSDNPTNRIIHWKASALNLAYLLNDGLFGCGVKTFGGW